MSHHEDFARLESIVEKLLNTVDQLRRDRAQMQEALLQKEEELVAARRTSDGLHEERDEILARVNRLIGTLEDWESGEAQESAAGSNGEDETDAPAFSLQDE